MKEGIKQRLIGGFVLAALAVIFLPGLFKEQEGHRVDSESHIPPPPVPQTVEFSAPDDSWEGDVAPQPETMFLPDDEPGDEEEGAAVVSASSVSSTAAPIPSAPSATSSFPSLAEVPVVPLDEKGIPQAWMVQLVSLSNRQAAIKLRDELQQDGYKAFIRETTTASGTYNRVFVGPNLNRDESLKIKTELDQRLNTNSQIRRFEP